MMSHCIVIHAIYIYILTKGLNTKHSTQDNNLVYTHFYCYSKCKKTFPLEVFTCFRHDANTLGDIFFNVRNMVNP